MAIGYNIIQPNGYVKKLRAEDAEKRDVIVQELLNRWTPYCERNWISANHNDPFCPESKVKLFLNGVAYFIMVGNTGGIVTDYKEMMNGKREIPVSSCPSCIEDTLYGSKNTLIDCGKDGQRQFESMLKHLDEKGKTPSKKPKARKITKSQKLRAIKQLGDCELKRCIVNTLNEFEQNGEVYKIDSAAEQYRPKLVGSDSLYDMDRILCVLYSDGGVQFYDMNYDLIPSEWIHKRTG